MHHRTVSLVLALAGGLAAVLAVLLVLAWPAAPVWAAPGELYVASGGDCGGASPCYDSVQAAVDAAAEGDVIKVATGVYTGVQGRPAPPGYQGPSVVDQVVYVNKTVTIRGGYTTTNWAVSHPLTQPTTLDAQGEGRVLFIAGAISPTIEGLRIILGDATGLGGTSWPAGGGVYVISATVMFNHNQIFSNTAYGGYGGGVHTISAIVTFSHNQISSNGGWGGVYFCRSHVVFLSNTVASNDRSGVALDYSSAIIRGNVISGNTAFNGGGLLLHHSSATISRNTIRGNDVRGTGYERPGGGILLYESTATISENVIIGNYAQFGGGIAVWGESTAVIIGNTISGNDPGGLDVYESTAVISGNLITSNTTDYNGAGVGMDYSEATFTGNVIAGNRAGMRGGGVSLDFSEATFTNNVIADNRGGMGGSGISVYFNSSLWLSHNTIARNHGGDGSGICVSDYWQGTSTGYFSRVALTNTVLVSHTVGISATAGSTATLEGTLWGDGAWANGTDWAGTGTILTGTVNVWGDPDFVDPDAGDYHIGPGSAAVDAGVDAGVREDMDGEPRPMRGGYDIGADELGWASLAVTKHASPEPVPTGGQLTYTIRVTNTGSVTLTVTITDMLPAHVTPTGVLTWTAVISAPGGVWQGVVPVTVTFGYSGTLTNTVEVVSEQGAVGYAEVSCTVVKHSWYLPLARREE